MRSTLRNLSVDTNLPVVFGLALIAVLRPDSLTPAFPGITQAFHVTSQQVALLISLFSLPSLVLTPVLGVLADRWGRKRILVPSLLIFSLAGGACALARDFNVLLVLRLIQGVGAAPLSMLNITLVADLYQGERATTTMGYNTAFRSIGSMLFPALGGLLAGLGWFYPFFLPLFALPVAALVAWRLKNPEPNIHTGFVEYLGGAWHSMRSWEVVRIFLAGGMTFIYMFGSYLGYYAFLLSDKFGASPFVIGLLISGRPVITALMGSQLGRLTRAWGALNMFRMAFFLYALVFLLIPFVPQLWMMAGITILLGTAEGFFWPSNHAALGRLAPLEHRAGFMAFNDLVMKLGQTVGPVLIGFVALIGGINLTFYVGAALAAGTCALFFVGERKRSL
ncbi:MAG TPA: MFS transporter [Anaerolineaceae bacterium]